MGVSEFMAKVLWLGTDLRSQRNIFIRESSSKMYSQVVFALAQLAAEVPYSILCAVAFFLLFYFPMVRVLFRALLERRLTGPSARQGFNMETSRAGYQFAVIFVTEFFASFNHTFSLQDSDLLEQAVTLGQAVGALAPCVPSIPPHRKLY